MMNQIDSVYVNQEPLIVGRLFASFSKTDNKQSPDLKVINKNFYRFLLLNKFYHLSLSMLKRRSLLCCTSCSGTVSVLHISFILHLNYIGSSCRAIRSSALHMEAATLLPPLRPCIVI